MKMRKIEIKSKILFLNGISGIKIYKITSNCIELELLKLILFKMKYNK